MASINYSLSVGKKQESQIKIRFINGRGLDVTRGIGIYIKPEYWDNKKQRIRNVIAVPNRDEINMKLDELPPFIKKSINSDFIEGEIIDKVWFEKTVANFLKRPTNRLKKITDTHRIYFSEFVEKWIKEKAPTHKNSRGEYITKGTIVGYVEFLKAIKDCEEKEKIRFSKINSSLVDNLAVLLSEKKYSSGTIETYLKRFRFFCKLAEFENIQINKSYSKPSNVYTKDQEFLSPYFNELEILKIYNHDFNYNKKLDAVRDNLIIGLQTGLRISDFLKLLDIKSFDADYIQLITQKTKTKVAIPIHWMVKEILKKRGGKLPPKTTDGYFNVQIRKIASILDFNELLLGAVKTVQENGDSRKVVKMYPKHELVSSHICRRSFATNNYGKIPPRDLMAICGWKTEEQMIHYIKKTNFESATALKLVFDEEEKKLKQA